MKYLAIVVIWCGLIAICAGVWVLAGYAWALIVIGVLLTCFGFAVIDIDAEDEGGKPA